jgi:type I restriction enzyme M protein
MKKFIAQLGFTPKENTTGIFVKRFPLHNNYALEVDFEKKIFYFGGEIKIYDRDIQNITKPEDWVVFECVNRLLEK